MIFALRTFFPSFHVDTMKLVLFRWNDDKFFFRAKLVHSNKMAMNKKKCRCAHIKYLISVSYFLLMCMNVCVKWAFPFHIDTNHIKQKMQKTNEQPYEAMRLWGTDAPTFSNPCSISIFVFPLHAIKSRENHRNHRRTKKLVWYRTGIKSMQASLLCQTCC